VLPGEASNRLKERNRLETKRMDVQCYPIAMVPGTTALVRDFADPGAARDPAAIRRSYPSEPFGLNWARTAPQL